MGCLSQVLPTVSVLSDDRGELREIVTDRYGADSPFVDHCCCCRILSSLSRRYNFSVMGSVSVQELKVL